MLSGWGATAILLYCEEDGRRIRRYWTTACQSCSLKCQCKTGPERRIPRWEHEHLLDAVQQRLDANQLAMSQRRETGPKLENKICQEQNEPG